MRIRGERKAGIEIRQVRDPVALADDTRDAKLQIGEVAQQTVSKPRAARKAMHMYLERYCYCCHCIQVHDLVIRDKSYTLWVHFVC